MALKLVRRTRERLRQATRMPRQLRPTQAGWMFLLIIMGVGFAALNTGNNLLYVVLSLLLAFLVLSGVLSESALRGIEIRRSPPREIFANADNPLLIEIRNTQKRVPAFAVVVEDRGTPASPALEDDVASADSRQTQQPVEVGRVFALRIGPECVESRAYALRPLRRGDLCFHSVRVSTRFPFGLFLKSRTIEARERVLVYPEIRDLGLPPPRNRIEDPATGIDSNPGAGNEVAGLREFEPGDNLRRVHWKSSLRKDQLLVRELEASHSAEIEVRLRTTGSDRGVAARITFEERVSWATSEILAHLEAGSRVGLVTDHDHIAPDEGPRQRTRLLSHLARVELETSAPARSRPAARGRAL